MALGQHYRQAKTLPIEVSAAYLEHLAKAWQIDIGNEFQCQFADQKIVVTVPASFDLLAQELTREAIAQAGFPEDTILLEEPLAAFYDWLDGSNDEQSQNKERILVCDIGGGTTDFSLFEGMIGDPASLKRIKVSDHILLGGDNIDLAIAHFLEAKLCQPGETLSSYSWAKLRQISKRTKETVSTNASSEDIYIAIETGGGDLFASTLNTSVSHSEIKTIMQSFVPDCDSLIDEENSSPEGIKEWGLPYAKDPAFTKHLARFLNGEKVDKILFAGGTMKSTILRSAIVHQIEKWQGEAPTVFESQSLDLAISRGAVSFLKFREEKQSIETAFPYSVSIEVKDGKDKKGVCIIPKGQSYGSKYRIDQEFQGLINQQVRFSLSRSANEFKAGEIHSLESTQVLSEIRSELAWKGKGRKVVSLELHCEISEAGLVKLFCRPSQDEDIIWPMTFDLSQRQGASSDKTSITNLWSSKTESELEEFIKPIFGKIKRPMPLINSFLSWSRSLAIAGISGIFSS